ncbi:MAG TPA: DUF2066 domain-containing protein [Stellaceae bacterium]|nr:DUF2066 domain-containing protein [Stellaceae bacterium]
MTLRLVSAAVGTLLLLLGAVAARAQGSDDPYTVTVKVDATADNVVHARDKARLDGQRKALGQIADNLKAKVPRLSDNAITDMVVSFEVADERMSTVRYSAEYTYHFRPADVQKALHVSGEAASAAAAGTGGKPALVLPVYQIGARPVLWEDPNPWRDAWAAHSGSDHLTVPLGDMADLSAIDGDKARGGDSETLAAIGKKYGADDVLVTLAAARGPADKPAALDISVKRYRAGQFVDVHGQSIDANPGESAADFFSRAVRATAAAIDGNWQGVSSPQNDQQGSLTVAVAISGLDDWLRLRDRISGLPSVRKIDLRSLSKQEATIELGYAGDVDQLTAALKGAGLDLVKGDPTWRLSPAGSSPPPPGSPPGSPPGPPPPGPPPGAFAAPPPGSAR